MPVKAVFNEDHDATLVEYDERPLAPNEVRIQTEYASGKHGTTMHMMDSRNRQGQHWDVENRLYVPSDESDPDPVPDSKVGTSGVGVISEAGADVREWNVGDRVFGFMDVSETNIITVDRPADFIWPGFAEPSPWLIWQLGDLDPLDASVLRAGLRGGQQRSRIVCPLRRCGCRCRVGRDRSADGQSRCAGWGGM